MIAYGKANALSGRSDAIGTGAYPMSKL